MGILRLQIRRNRVTRMSVNRTNEMENNHSVIGYREPRISGRVIWGSRRGQIATLFVVGIIYAVLIAPFHHNDGCILNTDCPLSQFVIDFSSCDKTDPQTLAKPGFTTASFIPEAQISIFGICPAALTTRAPPVSLRSIVV